MYQSKEWTREGATLEGYEEIIGRTYGHLAMQPADSQSLCEWQVDGVVAGQVTFSRVRSNAALSSHVSVEPDAGANQNIVIMCVEDGVVEYKERYRHIKCGSRSIMLMNTGKKMDAGQNGSVTVYSVTLPTHLLMRHCPRIEDICGIQTSSEYGLGVILRDIVKTMTEERSRSGRYDPNCFFGVFGNLVNSLYILDGDTNQDARLLIDYREKIENIIQVNIRNPELSPAFIAINMGVSLSYLYKIAQRIGISFENFIIETRLQYCNESLSDPRWINRSISEIAFYWGFKDCSHFSRRFTAKFGKSPKAFRLSETRAL